MHDAEVLVGLMSVIVALVSLSRHLKLPYPILLVLGGLALGFLPGLPRVSMPPDLVLVAFLPPLLYSSALTLSWREFQSNLRPISLLATGLVLSTTAGVALVAHTLVPGLPWAAAAVLGAIVAPTDAVASGAIARQIHLPRRLVTIIEDESLVNDATSLVVYRLAVIAAVTGHFSALTAGVQFLWASAGGIGVGLAVGWAIGHLRRRMPEDPTLEATVSLLTPFVAYIPAELLHVSGVLAVLAQGAFLGRLGAHIITAPTRLLTSGMWRMIDFLLNGLLFLLVGLQLRPILERLSGQPYGTLALEAAAIGLTVIAARFLWVFPLAYLPHLFSPRLRERDPLPPWQWTTVLAWTGMRGGLSLAAALALPLTIGTGRPFPQRDLLIFLTFSVILATLVAQGLTLTPLIKRLAVRDDGEAEREATEARLKGAQAALARLDEMEHDDDVPAEAFSEVRGHFQHKLDRLEARHTGDMDTDADALAASHRHLLREVVAAERQSAVTLRDDAVISDDVLHDIQQTLDLEEQRLAFEEKAEEEDEEPEEEEASEVGQASEK